MVICISAGFSYSVLMWPRFAVYICKPLKEPIVAFLNDMKKKPRENFCLGKNPPKNSTSHIVY